MPTSIASPSRSVPVDSLIGYTLNPRRGDVDLIKESLSTLGQYKAIVVNVGTKTGRVNEVLAGNHTLMAATELGWTMIDAQHVDVDDVTAAKIMLVDNRSNDVARYDNDLLAELLSGLDGDLSATGFTADDLDDLLMAGVKDLDQLAAEVGEPQDDDHWPSVTIKVSPDTEVRWRAYVRACDDEADRALSQLLDLLP